MGLVRIRKFSYIFSIILVATSVISLAFYGLKFGIDFTGGSLIEIQYSSRPDINIVRQKMEALNLGQVVVQPAGDAGFSIRTRELSTDERQKITIELSKLGEIKDSSANTIGPTIGQELRSRSIWAMILVLVAIILYIAFAFRKVSLPVSSWFYGIFAVIALFHDVFIPLGVFSLLGHFKGVEVDTLFVTAILTVLGFSVHDTIVVFDRIRENLTLAKKETFEETVGKSLSQTLTRSINTSLTVLVVLTALFFLGAEATKYFALALIIGIVAGTYSSIFIASPLLVTWNNYREKKA
ncbi:protein-export membrane protein SecF [Candidatus Giovannonibacteria bacterium RIFCSPLOWO2_12_FULL_43_11c]|uniref:Protein-export membrane protein SecF n=1 Tax=Candidatus Giovannonibacteria bacterium RIFCSPHIGHO2_12_FULL_43_15 TaxID=1798341 RepID=A0A1F5WRM1_9BACT|nr:MAG: protein-export membrane protein SecF [Candidatus Giovannonibacteria bacterium RIFCSPHIGHO2_01_FULL_43_100]OGF67277.1 MAG: protein-export membrane protein SecF [Candidatus Giovannonibacteria bacterium RIFCSPHIGHO2_02_FULL_43_32]OGF78270.1 MAG: protein-export membrane protein SecF [Candidatus Giovannonibacteria bacterium RIFCSPHIGHO2_12_FULL_43_15]OGF78775.1 MAG: protein-export membrane protein SecF [Candidatus Giovannonibacteria bacterium RIFCSPLOWO2_01_FULL_43_60]OGF92197.1 MAG: protein